MSNQKIAAAADYDYFPRHKFYEVVYELDEWPTCGDERLVSLNLSDLTNSLDPPTSLQFLKDYTILLSFNEIKLLIPTKRSTEELGRIYRRVALLELP